MIVRKTHPVPVECVVRGYLSGSGWKDYLATGTLCGIELPPALRESDRLPAPMFASGRVAGSNVARSNGCAARFNGSTALYDALRASP